MEDAGGGASVEEFVAAFTRESNAFASLSIMPPNLSNFPTSTVRRAQPETTNNARVENAEGTEPFCEEVFRLDARGFFARKKGE